MNKNRVIAPIEGLPRILTEKDVDNLLNHLTDEQKARIEVVAKYCGKPDFKATNKTCYVCGNPFVGTMVDSDLTWAEMHISLLCGKCQNNTFQ